jgi:hypothetical protein
LVTLLLRFYTYQTVWNFKKVFKKLKNEENIVLYTVIISKKLFKKIFFKIGVISVISVKVIENIKEYRLHFYYVITLIRSYGTSKKFLKN